MLGTGGETEGRSLLLRLILASYPRWWRRDHGDEAGRISRELLAEGRRPRRLLVDLSRGSLSAHLRGGPHPAGRDGNWPGVGVFAVATAVMIAAVALRVLAALVAVSSNGIEAARGTCPSPTTSRCYLESFDVSSWTTGSEAVLNVALLAGLVLALAGLVQSLLVGTVRSWTARRRAQSALGGFGLAVVAVAILVWDRLVRLFNGPVYFVNVNRPGFVGDSRVWN